ncbi:hypothetical protein TNCV_2389701 [Trichonephila clavipes]|nr:hypothetical protein TNCV_2389701 [Trichonephila clavipes]
MVNFVGIHLAFVDQEASIYPPMTTTESQCTLFELTSMDNPILTIFNSGEKVRLLGMVKPATSSKATIAHGLLNCNHTIINT